MTQARIRAKSIAGITLQKAFRMIATTLIGRGTIAIAEANGIRFPVKPNIKGQSIKRETGK